jgi:two-component system phosphate regulon sensor histidine kinase PhoR
MRDAAVIVDSEGNVAWANDSADFLLGINYPSDEGLPLLDLINSLDFREYFTTDDYSDPLRVLPEGDRGRCVQFEVARFGMGDRLVFARDVTRTFRLEQMRRDFVGNVSHELRTPLTVMKGYIETLQSLDEFSEARFQKPLDQMGQQALRMENLVTDLLWLSRIEAVETLRKTELIDMPMLIKSIVSELQPAYPERLIVLNQESDAAIRGDERELHSALSNLVVNSLKYSDGDVNVAWQSTDDVATFSVKDTGSGIEPHHLARLTERFYRVDKSRSNAGGGTGLGLAIVKHVANSHQAELTIDSTVGVGSCFGLAFPFDAADAL